MNQILKSFFASAYPLFALIGVLIAVNLYINNFVIAAIGLALISIPILFLLGMMYVIDVVRTSANLLHYGVIVLVGFALLSYAFYIGDAKAIAGIGFPLVACWFLYIYWYSVFQDRSSEQLEKGQKLPDLQFEDVQGNVVFSKSFLGKKSILLFYGGNWCPLCMAQINELSKECKVLEAKEIQTILISPQPHKNSLELLNKFDNGFQFLVDKDGFVASQLNILAKIGLPAGIQALGYDSDTVMPTVLLVDELGVIIHSDLTSNYRVRPEPGELINHFQVG